MSGLRHLYIIYIPLAIIVIGLIAFLYWSSYSQGSPYYNDTTRLRVSKSVNCTYGADTWSGDASKVGYKVTKIKSQNGNPASFSVKLNAKPDNKEVVGYPSVQCLMYSAIPDGLTSAFFVTPPQTSKHLDYEYSYDIWLTTANLARQSDWNNDLELMIWTYNKSRIPSGSVKSTLAGGAKIWISGNNKNGTVSVVLPQNLIRGEINLYALINELKNRSFIAKTDNGILDIEYGIEAPYGGNQVFTLNSLSVRI